MDAFSPFEERDLKGAELTRRFFLKRMSLLAGGAAAAMVMTPLVASSPVSAAQTFSEDPRLESGYKVYKGPAGDVRAYCTRLKQGAEKAPGVVVVHENKGLNPHIEDVARRLALEGFLALAPDALSAEGGTPVDQKLAVEMIRKLDPAQTLENFSAAVRYLDSHPKSTGMVGVVGFCWGGAMANQLAVNCPELDAAVPYYGRQPDVDDVPKIKTALLLHYAGLDERINKGIPAYEAALKAAGKDFRIYYYEGAQHAFNNDANPARYNQEAAELAWVRTIGFLNEKLKKT